jgi:AmiR/NasT family two-component response regulator
MDDPLALTNGDLAGSAELHQATGMLIARLDVSATDAAARLRAHAASTRRPLIDVSRDIIARRLRLPMPTNPTDESD